MNIILGAIYLFIYFIFAVSSWILKVQPKLNFSGSFISISYVREEVTLAYHTIPHVSLDKTEEGKELLIFLEITLPQC